MVTGLIHKNRIDLAIYSLCGLSLLLFIIGATMCGKHSEWEEIPDIYRLSQHFLVINIIIGSILIIGSWIAVNAKRYKTAYLMLSLLTIEVLMVCVATVYTKDSVLGWLLILTSILPQYLVILLEEKSNLSKAKYMIDGREESK